METRFIAMPRVTIRSSADREYSVEYSLVDRSTKDSPSYLQIISTDVQNVSGSYIETVGQLHYPLDSFSGKYLIQVLLKDARTDEMLAADETSFEFIQGQVPSFDVLNFKAEITPPSKTQCPVQVRLSAEILDTGAIQNVHFRFDGKDVAAAVDANGIASAQFKINRNGTYTAELSYEKNGRHYTLERTVVVDNIVGTPQTFEITFTMDRYEIVVGDTVCFTINAPGATMVKPLVDDVCYEGESDYATVENCFATFDRTFSQAGERYIQFSASADGEHWGELCEGQILMVKEKEVAKAQINKVEVIVDDSSPADHLELYETHNPGDVIFVRTDDDDKPDRIDWGHAMIVTRVVGQNIYYSGHTRDRCGCEECATNKNIRGLLSLNDITVLVCLSPHE